MQTSSNDAPAQPAQPKLAESFLIVICPNMPQRFAETNDHILNSVLDVFEALNAGLKCMFYYDTQRLTGYPMRVVVLRVLKAVDETKKRYRPLTTQEAKAVNVEIEDEIKRVCDNPFYADFFSYPTPSRHVAETP